MIQLVLILLLAIVIPPLIVRVLAHLKTPIVINKPLRFYLFSTSLLLLSLRGSNVIEFVKEGNDLIAQLTDKFWWAIINLIITTLIIAFISLFIHHHLIYKQPNKKPKKRYLIVASISLLISFSLIAARSYITQNFGQVTAGQLIFNLIAPIQGVSHSQVAMALLNPVINVALLFVLVMALLDLKEDVYFHDMKIVLVNDWRKLWCCGGLLILVLSSMRFFTTFGLGSFISQSLTPSNFIQEHYVDPNNVNINVNNHHNLIHIYMESGENTFANQEYGGYFKDNAIPDLTALSSEGISFTNNSDPSQLGGAICLDGSNWTIAGMVSMETGVPLKVQKLNRNDVGYEGNFLPGIVASGNILEAAGYKNYFMMGSDQKFAGRGAFFKTHGNYQIYDINDAKEEQLLPQDYNVNWGMEDEKLFELAKPKLNDLSNTNQPFNFGLITTDTHAPDGYYDPNQPKVFEEDYLNAVYYGQLQIANFVRWCQQQPWYENTTIVITGDHISMNDSVMSKTNDKYQRTIYNVFLNPSVEPNTGSTLNRSYTELDYFPTILASIGFGVEGDKLGLGTNLFSGQPTLAEEMGITKLSQALGCFSEFYLNNFVRPKEPVAYNQARLIYG